MPDFAVNFSLTVNPAPPPPSTFTAGAGPFFAPVAPGTVIGSVVGTGPYAVASPFVMSGTNVVVGAVALAAGGYTITGTGSAGASPFNGAITVQIAASFAPAAGPFFSPLAAGTIVGQAAGPGAFSVSAPFVMADTAHHVAVGATPLTAGPYTISGSSGGSPFSGSIVVNTPAVFTPGAGPFYSPLAVGAVVGSVTGVGALVVASPFAMSGTNVVVAGAPLTVGTYTVLGTAGGVSPFSGSIAVTVAATYAARPGPFFAPLASGTIVGTVTGPAPFSVASPFAMSGSNVVVGATPLTAATYSITGTAGTFYAWSGSVLVSASVPATLLSARVTIPGQTPVTYSQSGAANMGDYVDNDPDGPFTMQCYRAAQQAGIAGLWVWFRPDSTSPRKEVVFELGDVTLATRAVASVTSGNPTIVTTSVPHGVVTGCNLVMTGLTYIAPNPFGSSKILSIDSPTQITVQRDTRVGSQVSPGAFIGTSTPVASIAASGTNTIIVTTTPHGLVTVGANVATSGLVYWTVNNIGPTQVVTVTSPTTFTVPRDSTLGTGAAKTASANIGAWNLPAHTVEIFNDGVAVHTENMPLHYWCARWRWQSAPRPVRKTPAQLVASKLVAVYDPSQLGRYTAAWPPQPLYSPMGFSGLVVAMGSGGPRQDIGLVPGWAAAWLANGNATDKASMLTHGECSGTLQMHIRDAAGKPMDAATFGGSFYPGGGSPTLITAPGLILYDDGHDPALSAVPAFATGDPYFIEALQFQPTMAILGKANNSFRWGTRGRYGAWRMRNILYAAKMTPPASPPAWMQSRAVFQTYLDKVRAGWITDMASTAPERAVFHDRVYGTEGQGTFGFPISGYAALWQTSMEAMVAWMAVQLGFPEWLPQAQWISDSDINRMNKISGMPRAVPAPYDTAFSYCCSPAAAMDATQTSVALDEFGKGIWPPVPFQVTLDSEKMLITGHDTVAGVFTAITRGYAGTTARTHVAGSLTTGQPWFYGPMMTSWAQCGERIMSVPSYLAGRAPDPSDPSGMNVLNHQNIWMENTGKARASLAMAVRNGHTPAADAYAWINGEFIRWGSSSWATQWAWMQT